MEITLRIKDTKYLEGKTLPLVNLAEDWGRGRGTRLWTSYSHNFRIGDYVYIDKGVYKNIPSSWDNYASPSRVSDFLTAYKVIWVDSRKRSLAINKVFIQSDIRDNSNLEAKVFISSNPFLNGYQENCDIKDIMVGYSENSISDSDFSTPNNDINYLTKFPTIQNSKINSGIVINGNLVNIDWNGGSVIEEENLVSNSDVFPRVLNANREEIRLYSIFKKGFFSGKWGGGLAERMIFNSGEFVRGTFKGGLWNDGIWYEGVMESFYNRLEIKNILWKSGIARNIIWRGGIWETGDWKGDDLYIVKNLILDTINIIIEFDKESFANHFVIGDIIILSAIKYVENPIINEIDYKPFYVVNKTSTTISINSNELNSSDIINSIDLRFPFKITNSCWNSGIWNGGIWRGGIKGDTSFWTFNIELTGPNNNHTFSVWKTPINTYPISGITQLNYEFRSTDIAINEPIHIWNITGPGITGWTINSGPSGATNPLLDFSINLIPNGETLITGINNELSPILIDLSYWVDGIWSGGLWMGGIWNSGEWQKGIWKDGVWNKGQWRSGEFRAGWWESGIFELGRMTNSINFNGITTTTYLTRSQTLYGITNPTRSLAGSTVLNNIIFNNGFFNNGLIINGQFNNGYWSSGNMFSLYWKNGIVLSDSPVSETNYQPGHFLYDNKELWGARIEGITSIGNKIHYYLQNGITTIAYDDSRLLHSSTNPIQTIGKTFLGMIWEDGQFNVEGTTTPTKDTAVWVRGDWKNGIWNHGSWSPLDNISLWDYDTFIPKSNNKFYSFPYLSYPQRHIDYSRGLRHNIFDGGSFLNGVWYRGYLMGGSISGGEIKEIYAVASSNDIDLNNVKVNISGDKYFVKSANNDIFNFKIELVPSILKGITGDVRSYSEDITIYNDFKIYDLFSVPGLMDEYSSEIRGITATNNNTVIFSIDLGLTSPIAIRESSFVEIRGLVKRSGGIPAINGFHFIKNVYDNNGIINGPLAANTGRVYFEITTPHLSKDIVDGLDWSSAYLYRGDTQIISDNLGPIRYNTLANNYNTNLVVEDVKIENNELIWISGNGLKPSVVSSNNIDIYTSAENAIYKNYFSSSKSSLRINKSELYGVQIDNDNELSDSYIYSSEKIYHSYIKSNSEGSNIYDSYIVEGTHKGLVSNRNQFKGVDKWGYYNKPIQLIDSNFGENSFVPFGITSAVIGTTYINFTDNLTGHTAFNSPKLGDIIYMRGLYGDYAESLGGSLSKGHLYLNTGQVKKPEAITYLGESIQNNNYVSFNSPYDGITFTYNYAYISANSFDNVNIIGGTGESAIFNRGILDSISRNMVVFSSLERNLTGPIGFVGYSNATINNNDVDIILSGGTFYPNWLSYLSFDNEILSPLSQYVLTTGITNVYRLTNISQTQKDYLLNNQNHLTELVHLRITTPTTLNIDSVGSNTNVWNTSSLQENIERKTKVYGNLTNSIIFKSIFDKDSNLLSVSNITGETVSSWVNGIFNSGGISGEILIENNTAYPKWNNLTPWWGGFFNGGELYGILWTRGIFNGGRFNSGIWESYNAPINILYNESESIFNGGVWRSVQYITENGETYLKNNQSASVWTGGIWNGMSGFYENGIYTNLSDPLQDYASLLRDDIIKSTWNGPFKEYGVDDKRSVILLGSSSIWLGGKWLRGKFNGGIFYNGIWWSSNKAISGPYPVDAYNISLYDGITTNNKPYLLSNTGINGNSLFNKGAFVSSIWEGGIFGTYNSGPTGLEENVYWKSKEYETIFGWYLPQDRNLISESSRGYDYSNPEKTTIADWKTDDSPFVFEYQKVSGSNQTTIFEHRYYEPKTITKSLLFGKKMFIPSSVNPVWQSNGLSSDIPQTSLFKRGLFNNGIAMWSIFDSLSHITSPTGINMTNWDYTNKEYHNGEVQSDCYINNNEEIYTNQPTLFRKGMLLNSYWNAGIIRNDKVTFNRSIWINGSWSDAESDKDPNYLEPIEYFNPYDSLALTGPQTITGGYGPPNSTSDDSIFNENNRISWEDAVTGITGNYGLGIRYIYDPSYKATNTLLHKNFHQSIWYSGLWHGGRFQLSVWNSYNPGSLGWGTRSSFTYTPFIGSTNKSYRNWVYQYASSDNRNRFRTDLISRYEIQEGAWPLGYIDTFNSRLTDNVQKIDLVGIVDSNSKDPINFNLLSQFDYQSDVSNEQIDGRYRVFPRPLVTGGDFNTWIKASDSNGTGPSNVLVKNQNKIDFQTYSGLLNSFALAHMAKIIRVVGPGPSLYLTTGPTGSNNNEIEVNLNGGTIPVGYLPGLATGTFWQGALTDSYNKARVLADIYKNNFNEKYIPIGITPAHEDSINLIVNLFNTTAFDNSDFDKKLENRTRLAGDTDNFASRWYRGHFRGSIWNGGVWETGLLEHYSVNGDNFAEDWFGRTLSIGQNYTLPSAWFRGLWKSGQFSTRNISERGIELQISSDKRSYKKSFFLSVFLPIPDDDYTSRYDNRTSHGLSETTVKSSIEYPNGKYPSTYKTIVESDYFLNDTSNLASWFTRTKKIENPDYYLEIERWFGANSVWKENNKHLLDWHYFSEFNGVFTSGIFLDLFKRHTYVMDTRGIPQRTPLLSSFAEWGKRPSPAQTRQNNIREGIIYGNQRYQWNWGYDETTNIDMLYIYGLNNNQDIVELSKGPYYYPFFITSRTLFRIGPDHINEVLNNKNFTSTDYAFPKPIISIGGGLNTTYITGLVPEFGDWYLTPGIPNYAFPEWAAGPTGIYNSDGNNMKNTIRIYNTDSANYIGASSTTTGSTGVESLNNNQYLATRRYFYDYFLYNTNSSTEIETYRFYVVVAETITVNNETIILNNISSTFVSIVGNIYGIPTFNNDPTYSGVYEVINVSGNTTTLQKKYFDIGTIIKANQDSFPVVLRDKYYRIEQVGMVDIGSFQPNPRKDNNYLSNNFILDGLNTTIDISGNFSHPTFLPNGHITGGTQPPYIISPTYQYPGLTGRIEEDLYNRWRLFPYWFYSTNKWKLNEEDIHNYGTYSFGPKFLGESRTPLKYIFDWIPTTGNTGWTNVQNNFAAMEPNDGWSQDYFYNNILDREYNYGQRWIGFDDNQPPTETHQTVEHYNFGDGYSWIWPKVLFTDIFSGSLFFYKIDPLLVTSTEYQFIGIPPIKNYVENPLITRFEYSNRGISNLILKKK